MHIRAKPSHEVKRNMPAELRDRNCVRHRSGEGRQRRLAQPGTVSQELMEKGLGLDWWPRNLMVTPRWAPYIQEWEKPLQKDKRHCNTSPIWALMAVCRDSILSSVKTHLAKKHLKEHSRLWENNIPAGRMKLNSNYHVLWKPSFCSSTCRVPSQK